LRADWRIVDRGVNGEPFLWKKMASKRFLMIDIFNPDPSRRCYSILIFPGNPNSDENLSHEVIGVGCAEGPDETWIDAYQHAREIAEEYMKRN
jgi:hypothetical protein